MTRNKVFFVNLMVFGILPAAASVVIYIVFEYLLGDLVIDSDLAVRTIGIASPFMIVGLVLGYKMAKRYDGK